MTTTRATVRTSRHEEGWGVIDSPDIPGGCWAHFSHLAMTGHRALTTGQIVELEWEAADQDGYSYRAASIAMSLVLLLEPTRHLWAGSTYSADAENEAGHRPQ